MTISLISAVIRCWPRRSSRGSVRPFRWSYRCALCLRDRPLPGWLSASKRLTAKNRACNSPIASGLPREKICLFPFAQQRLWFLDQYEPNSSLYNIPSALRLRGSLDVGSLGAESKRDHPASRESSDDLFDGGGEPVQVIAPSVELSLAVVDLRDHPESEREEEARRACQRRSPTAF